MPATAVLLSAGLDSAVLAAAEARGSQVHPVYVSCGLAWEAGERAALHRLLACDAYRDAAPLAALAFPVTDLYPPSHWALRGEPPGAHTPDAAVYLAGRNIVLLSKAAIYCAQRGIERLAIGPLAGNPFPDATPAFFDAMATALSLGLATPLAIVAPLIGMKKSEVIQLGAALGVPLQLTVSCMSPRGSVASRAIPSGAIPSGAIPSGAIPSGAPSALPSGVPSGGSFGGGRSGGAGRGGDLQIHCGQCNKCRERRDGFREAGIADPTVYAVAAAG